MNTIRDWLLSLIGSALHGFDEMLQGAINVLSQPLGQWDTINFTIAGALRPFCYTIIGICLLIELAQVAAKVDIIKWEMGLKIAVKMVLAKVAIDMAPTVLQAIYLQVQDWVVALGGGGSTMGSDIYDQIHDLVIGVNGLWNILGMFLSSFIVLMAIKICGLIVEVIAYGRIFEIYIYLAVSPIPCAFFPLGNGNGDGFSPVTGKFFKSFAAICLQGVMMVVVIQIFGAVIGGAITAAAATAAGGAANEAITNLIYVMLLGSIALVMAIVKCGSWAKSILDAM